MKLISINREKVFKVLMFITLLVLLIISDQKLPLSIYIANMPALNSLLIIGMDSLIFFIFFKKNWKFDLISIFLIMRMLFSSLTFLMNKQPVYSNIKQFFIFYIALITYLIFSNCTKYISSIFFRKVITGYLLIISSQTIIVCLIGYKNFFILTKDLIEIPIGKSNFIGAHILVSILYLLFNKNKLKLEKVIILLGLISLVLTFSFGAIATFIIIIILKNFISSNISKKKRILISFVTIGILLYLIFVLFRNTEFSNKSTTGNILRNISIKIGYLLEGNFERLFSDRFLIYKSAWNNFLKSPIIGGDNNIIFRGEENFRAHNFLLEGLAGYGFFGFLMLLGAVSSTLNKLYKNLNKKGDQAILMGYLALMSGVIHGLFEPNFFSLHFEFLWWMIAGYTVSIVIKYNKYKELK